MFAKLRLRMKGWKTVAWNIFLALIAPISIGLQKLDAIDWSLYVGPFAAIGIGVLIGAVGVYLRWISTGPVGSKGDEAPAPDVKAGD